MRRRDWEQRFAEFSAERRERPFEWGANDCCLFAADAVLAITDVDFAEWARGTYDDSKGALRLITARGGLLSIGAAALGSAASPQMAAVGDVVLLMNKGRELFAICNGTSAIAPGPDGLVALGMDAALAAWKI